LVPQDIQRLGETKGIIINISEMNNEPKEELKTIEGKKRQCEKEGTFEKALNRLSINDNCIP
jgi:hypothetical protein